MNDETTTVQTVRDLRRRWKPHKERLLAAGSEQATSIRFHRACSWMARVEQMPDGQDHDLGLVNLWIAFNSLYGQWDCQKREPKPDRESWRAFINRILKLDRDGCVSAALQEHKRLVMALFDDEYVSAYFWQEPTAERGRKARRSASNAQSWYVEKRWTQILDEILARIYVMRCQLVHGAARRESARARRCTHQVAPGRRPRRGIQRHCLVRPAPQDLRPRGLYGQRRSLGTGLRRGAWLVRLAGDAAAAPRAAFAETATARAYSGSELSGLARQGSVSRTRSTLRRLVDPYNRTDNDVAVANKGSNWTREEVEAIVADYFAMLREELLGRRYSKTEHRNQLQPMLLNRSAQFIEFKHANISAVLAHFHYPYIDGYKPRANYQRLLVETVEAHLAGNPGFFEPLAASRVLSPDESPAIEIPSAAGVFEEPPERIEVPEAILGPWWERPARRLDFVERDARDRRLGKLGEQFVVNLECRRLVEAEREDLAERVEWISETRGDGPGFDVRSFNLDASDRLIEVKATGLGKYFPFYVTANEVRCSEYHADTYHLYRVFRFSRSPGVYVLSGALSKTCHLEAIQYRASI
jgi:hypothetical protein